MPILVRDGVPPNRDVDPNFVSDPVASGAGTDAGDLHPQSAAVIDSGDTLDLGGNNRKNNGTVDIGVYER